jgi:TATA-binding protein-associated factor
LTRRIEYFDKQSFNICILDEAHLIKNEKSKLAQVVKSLEVKHKLALTGTPIQNNLLELWSIFDFLMPQYLGEKDSFKKEHKNLFNLNMISKDVHEIGLDSSQNKDLELLHKRVLPFIMRRLKTQVLKDLPPKII